jgi:type I restriction enzyme S subunit
LEDTSIKLNPVNTLSIAMYGEGRTRGNISILKSEMTTNQASCNLVIDENKADHEFVYYFLKTQYNQLRNLSSGVRNNLNSNDIKNFEIRLPKNIATQKKIAAVLSALDAKIELNNRINAELESLAKTIYDYWFVQFDFPFDFAQGKPSADGKPYKSSGGEMVYVEELKREIPAGWTNGILGDLILINSGFPFESSSNLSSGEYKIVTIKNVQPKYLDTVKLNYVNQLPNSLPDYCKLSIGDLLISLTGDVGRVCFVNEQKLLLNQRVGVIRPKYLTNSFIYYLLQSQFVHRKLLNMATGSNQKNLSPIDMAKLKLPIPNRNLIDLFSKKVNPIFQNLIKNQQENQQLTQLRDWLLPMLMNGQVSIK